jgi:8-oxo-dGTP pyrophosphatase MutT (NUDIX family)
VVHAPRPNRGHPHVTVNPVVDAIEHETGRWRTFGEREIYDCPWMWLGQIDVELPSGERFWHHVVRLHQAALMVLLDDQDRVLLLWRHRFLPDRWGWEIPGGLVDDGEEPAAAARRELAEETGYRAGQVEHLITFQPAVGQIDSEHWVYVGREPERAGDPTDISEAARIDWFPLSSIPEMITTGAIWNGGTLLSLMRLLMLGPDLAPTIP